MRGGNTAPTKTRKEKKGMRTVKKLFEDVFEMDGVELDMDKYWDLEDIIGQEICGVFENGCVDDLSLSAYASNTHGDLRIHGQFRFCVYGGLKYEELRERLENMQSDILTVEDIYHPEQTYGISFNGVYENEDTTYVGGKYVLRRA